MRIAAQWGVVLICLGMLALGCSHPSVDCPKAFKVCGQICVDTATDVANCGACGTACAAGQVCSAGTCATTCQAGLNVCGGSCRDLQTDAANCGACGTACILGQSCIAGVCGCQPGMACGPAALVYSDGFAVSPVQAVPDAVGAMKLVKGSAINATSGAQFNAQYDSGRFDVVFFDMSNSASLPAGAPERLYDWVKCGGRLVYNNWGWDAWEQTLMGVTASAGFNPNRPTYADPTSPANLFSGIYTVPSPLAVTAAALPWGSFGVEVTPAPPTSGFVAARYNSATGTNAIAVTNGNRVIVHGFLPSDYQAVDSNTNGIPDLQELYANEVAYLFKQGPAAPTCSAIETFDVGPWPIAPWTAAGTPYGALTAGCAHNGAQGFSDNLGGNGPGLWYYRTDVTVGNAGERLSMWILTPSVAANGLFFQGFGSTATGGWSFFANVAGNTIIFLQNNTWTTYNTLASTPVTFSTSTWYRMEVEFGAAGAVTGRVYASDGVTVLGTLSTTLAGFAPGGVAFQITGQAATACADTIKVYR